MDLPKPTVLYDTLEPSLRTGDLFIFHGTSDISLKIEKKTKSLYSHSAMVIRPDITQPPLIWQAGPDPIIQDWFTRSMHGGAQISTLREALVVMSNPAYGDTGYVRQLQFDRTPEFETVAMWAIAGLDGRPFPTMKAMLAEYQRGQKHVTATDKTFFCSELVAHTFMMMGLLPFDPPPDSYAPGSFSSAHGTLPWMRGASLGPELQLIPPAAASGSPATV